MRANNDGLRFSCLTGTAANRGSIFSAGQGWRVRSHATTSSNEVQSSRQWRHLVRCSSAGVLSYQLAWPSRIRMSCRSGRAILLSVRARRSTDADPGGGPEAPVLTSLEYRGVAGAQPLQPLARHRGSNPKNFFEGPLGIPCQGQESDLLVKQGQTAEQGAERLNRGRGRVRGILRGIRALWRPIPEEMRANPPETRAPIDAKNPSGSRTHWRSRRGGHRANNPNARQGAQGE